MFSRLGIFAATLILGAALLMGGPVSDSFAQTAAVVATDATIVAPTPAVEQAVVEQSEWAKTLNQLLTAFVGFLTAAVGVLAPVLFTYIRSRSKLAGILIGQALQDKLTAAMQNQIRVEAGKLGVQIGAGALPLTMNDKKAITEKVQPVIERRFQQTLKHFGKPDGSGTVRDMIIGRVDEALAKPAPGIVPAGRG